MLKKGDLLVVALILTAAVVLFFYRPASSGQEDRRTLQIELDGSVIREVSFDSGTTELITVALPAGEATVQLENGRVRVLPMDRSVCPLGFCSSVGWVEYSGEAIVCMPNRLVLRIRGGPVNELWESLDGVTK